MATMHDKSWIVLAAAIPFFLPDTASAQRLTPGQRIRVTAPRLQMQRQPGQLVRFDRDSLILVSAGQRWFVPRQLLTQLDASGGRRGHLLAGVLVGAVVGAVAGLIAISPEGTCTGSGDYGAVCRGVVAFSVGAGAALGALVGTLVRTERWVPVPLDSPQFVRPP